MSGDLRKIRQRPTDAETPQQPPKRKRRSWRLLGVLALLALLVALAPSIVANTPLSSWVIRKAAADLKGSVTVDAISLGWLSPISVRGVEVKDADNKPIFSLPAATSDRTLLALLCNYADLGKWQIQGPKLSLVVRDKGSNVEDLLAGYLTPTEPRAATSPTKWTIAVEVVEGGLSVTDQRLGQTWTVDHLAASFAMSDGVGGSIGAKLSADVLDGRQPGKLTAQAKTASGAGEASLNVVGLPLGMFRALVERVAPGTTCDGRLAAAATASWGGSAGKNRVEAELGVEGFSLAAPALQSDVVQLEQLRASCAASWQADRVEIEKATVDCDVGNASLTSNLELNKDETISINSLLRQQHRVSGRIELARLARILPATLRLQQQVEIKSGNVQWVLTSQAEQAGMKWHGQLDAADLTGSSGGRPLAWQQPLSLVFDAHGTLDAPIVDALQCRSDFLTIEGAGTKDRLAATLQLNLKQLFDQLGQFVDFGTLQLAGEGSGKLNWERSAQSAFSADGEFHLQGFQLAMPDRAPWQENELTATLSAKGQTNLDADMRIDAAAVSVKTAADQFDAQLAQPVQNLRDGGVWRVRVQSQGQLQNWPGQVAAWFVAKDCRLTGAYGMDADLTASSAGVEVRQVRFAAAPMILTSSWLNINEPRIDVSVAGSWNQQQRRLQITPASLQCATASIQASNVVVAVPEKGSVELAGSLQYQGDAARLHAWFADPNQASTWRLAGQLNGTVQVRQSSGVISAETTNDVTNLAVIDSSGQQFQEPRIRVAARASYNNQNSVVQLDQFEIASESQVLAANIAGRIAPVSGVNNAQLDGSIGCDLERVAGLLRPYLGRGVHIRGRSSQPASYRGPFSLVAGQATAGLRWDGANIYGLQVGPGELKAAMSNGLLQIAPLDLAVSQGRMHLAPTVRLTPDPMELTMPAGMVAQQIQIDPALCASMLKYIAPIVADVATAQGSFSVQLGDPAGQRPPCRIPLSDPAKGDLTGQLVIHSIEIGPGPLVRAFAVLLGRETPAKLRNESVIPFQMVQGRIYHQGMELNFPEFTVRTSGSVGIADQTIAIMAEMPVPPKWIENNPAAANALRGQTLRIPIGGTLSNPQLDQRAIESLTRQFLQKATQNVIEGELNKQLDRLFGPKN